MSYHNNTWMSCWLCLGDAYYFICLCFGYVIIMFGCWLCFGYVIILYSFYNHLQMAGRHMLRAIHFINSIRFNSLQRGRIVTHSSAFHKAFRKAFRNAFREAFLREEYLHVVAIYIMYL